jgi:ATP-dependent DNA helicase DinG
MIPKEKSRSGKITLPAIPMVAVNAMNAAVMTNDGEVKLMPIEQAQLMLHKRAAIVCHAPFTKTRLQVDDLLTYDLLELFAFVHPAKFCVPTPVGLAKALGLEPPSSFEDYPYSMMEIGRALLMDLQTEPRTGPKSDPLEIARVMGLQGKGWPWTPYICRALNEEYDENMPVIAKVAMNVWKHMPEWSEQPPPPPPTHYPVSESEVRERLLELTTSGAYAEKRTAQNDYAIHIAKAFAPRNNESDQHLVLAEAGTGVGKTLGYLAPASLWAEKNDGAVWIATYTKALQKQIFRELDRLYPDPTVKARRVAVRKGRENYLCLLNLDEMVTTSAISKDPRQIIASGIMTRWAERSLDGDLQGGDFPGWLAGLIGYQYSTSLSDQRGECIFSACDHYHRCFVERSIRKSQHASVVVANHAVVMTQAAITNVTDPLPQRYIFDEGHHLFEAADSAFAGHLTARETHDLRRWIRGPEGGRKTRARGLRKRVEDLIAGDEKAALLLDDIIYNANCLPAFGWSIRLRDKQPAGSAEQFLMICYEQIMARAEDKNSPYSLETPLRPVHDSFLQYAQAFQEQLKALQKPMRQLVIFLRKKLEDQADTLDSDARRRLEYVATSIERRSEYSLTAWINMLQTLMSSEDEEGFVDWLEVERVDGKAVDIGMYRHYTDPMKPFTESLAPHIHGMVVTSATLRDATGDISEDWRVARERTGMDYFETMPSEFVAQSPYNYVDQTRIFIIDDIRKDDLKQVASAYRELFKASGGGALGLFTAIHRLKAVYHEISGPLEKVNLPLYAQHIDGIDTGTLVDIFRDDLHASLLGTDAVRDGIDVPGESLRLLVYDRVPWQRPTILHKARRLAFGQKRYDDLITRLKLRQAFGRLVRRADDRGVFVMLDSRLPSALKSAFPEGVIIEKCGLSEALVKMREFLK